MSQRDPFLEDWAPPPDEVEGLFTETHWSVLDGLNGSVPQRKAALESLCRCYLPPLVSYARARGVRACDAEDLVQGFFLSFLSRDGFDAVRRREGKLRSFLVGAFENYRIDEWRKARAEKRGGGVEQVPMAEEHEPPDGETPERIYDRAWARALTAAALERLRQEVLTRPDGEAVWQALGPLITEPEASRGACREAARAMGTAMGTARTRLDRLRRRYETVLFVKAAATLREYNYKAVLEELRALHLAP